jgi:hypothetical protein
VGASGAWWASRELVADDGLKKEDCLGSQR